MIETYKEEKVTLSVERLVIPYKLGKNANCIISELYKTRNTIRDSCCLKIPNPRTQEVLESPFRYKIYAVVLRHTVTLLPSLRLVSLPCGYTGGLSRGLLYYICDLESPVRSNRFLRPCPPGPYHRV